MGLDTVWQSLQSCAQAQPPLPLIITGPTASGKTGLALAAAKRFDIEIVSADSALIYQGMDIGTAKPSTEELANVAHHLIDIMKPHQSYSAAQFAHDATQLIQDIQSRGKLPLIVGGTMLYIKALREGLDDIPSSDSAVRAEIQTRALERGWPALHQELARIDPQTATRLAPLDAQRISRALEVYLQTGKPLSSFWTQGKNHKSHPHPNSILIPMISLEPHNRAWLHERIAQRFHQMLELGLVEEVGQVYESTQCMMELEHSGKQVHARDLPSMRCVGYRQVIDSLEARQDWSSLTERGIAATRQLAKRQLTWLRGMERTVLANEWMLDTH